MFLFFNFFLIACTNSERKKEKHPVEIVAAVSGRLNADVKQISLAGFSGGAKVALVAASQSSSLLSIIYCGAGLPQIPQQLSKILFTGSVSGPWKIKYSRWMKAWYGPSSN